MQPLHPAASRKFPSGRARIAAGGIFQCSSRSPCGFDAVECSSTGSIKVASSVFPGLLTRFDTGHIRRASSGAGRGEDIRLDWQGLERRPVELFEELPARDGAIIFGDLIGKL